MKLLKFLIGRLKSFVPASQGLFYILKHEKNAWVHLTASVIAIIIIFLLKLNYLEALFFISAIFFVWIAEIFNSAIEYVLDFIQPTKDPKIKIIKDISAAGVLLAALYALIVALIILLSRIIPS